MASRVIAVDLGTYSVKVAVANPGFRHTNVIDFIERAVPSGERASALSRSAGVLRQVLEERGIDADDDSIYAAVPGNMVSNRILEFGFRGLKRADLEKAVGAELEGVLPYDLDEMVYTFDSLPRDLGGEAEVRAPQRETSRDGVTDDDPTFVGGGAGLPVQPAPGVTAGQTTGMRVFACAMPQDRARELLGLLSVGGQEPRGLIVGATGFARVVDRIESLHQAASQGESVAIVDMGHQRTDVCVIRSGRVIFARTIERGGRDITEAIAKSWNIPFEEAEKAKHSDGFIGSSAEPPSSDAWARIHGVVASELDPLARELRLTLKACRAETGARVGAAVVVGGGSRLRGASAYFSEQLAMPVSTLGAGDAERILGPELAGQGVPADIACCAAGVALDGATGGVMFDLRQGALAFKADFSFLRQKIAHLAAAALVIIAFAAGNAYASLYKLRASEAALTERLALETRSLKGREMDADEVLGMVGPSQVVEQSPMPKMSAYDILLEINAKMPKKDAVTLDVKTVDIRAGNITIQAQAANTEEIGAIRKALESIECFEDVSKPNISSGADDVKNFSLSIKSRCM